MTSDPIDQMLDEITKQKQAAQTWEQTCHLIAQTLYDISRQDGFNPTTQFADAVLAYNRAVRNKYRTPIKQNRSKDLSDNNP